MSNTQVAIDAIKKLYEVTEQRDELIKALEFAFEAVDFWGAYASDYFKEKHGFDADLKTIKEAIAKAKGEE